jgi:hypothetical protein
MSPMCRTTFLEEQHVKTRTALAVFLATCLSVSTAAADPFTVLPNGELVFNVDFSSEGAFRCLSGIVCSGSGTNTVTIGSGENVSRISFIGQDGSAQIGGTALVPVTLGHFEVSSSEGFVYPRPSQNAPLLLFDLVMRQSSPVSAGWRLRWTFGPGGSESLSSQEGATYLQLPTGPNPPGFNYEAIVYTIAPVPFTLPSNGTYTVNAEAGAVPEPATLVLLGTGLAGVVAARRRKRSE